MSQFWPHTRYHEDQPYSHAILHTHVLTRAVQMGTIVGTGIGTSLHLLRRSGFLTPKVPRSTLTKTILRSSGIGVVIATSLLAVGTEARMWGREEIEWQDRSWRLLENRGQLECDDWTYSGMAAGLVSAAAGGKRSGWRGAIGKVGLGSVAGMFGYLGWRYGVHEGKFEDEGKLRAAE
ncbi:unnamed protein product [Calypogeia fissa]